MSFNTGRRRLFSKYERFARLYAKMLMSGTVNYRQLVNVYDRSEQQPEIKAKKLLRLRAIQDVVTDEILKIYDDNGITPDFILKKRLEVLNTAMSQDRPDLSNANKVLESFEAKLIDNKEIKTTQTEVISFTNMLESGKKVKLTGKKETKSLEMPKETKNEAIRSDLSQDKDQGNDNV